MERFLHFRYALLFMFSLLLQNVVGQQFKWAKRAGFYAYDYGYAVGTDNAGNLYMSGKYEMDSRFDDTTVTCAGNHDVFVSKYDVNGKIQWVRTSGGDWGDYAHASATDKDGNTYVTGEFETTMFFPGETNAITTYGSNDIFISKYNSVGDLLWVKRAGGSKSDQGLAIAIGENAVYVAGKFKLTALFDNVSVTSLGDDDIFLAKYDLNGNFKWVRRAGGILEDEAYGVTVDPNGDVYVTGYFGETAEFNGVYYNGKGMDDIFLSKYDSNGNFKWVKTAGGNANDKANAVKAGKDGRIYITGGFRVQSYWDNINLWANLGDLDIFIACYSSNGEAIWVKKAGGNINDEAFAIDVDTDFNSYITGYIGYSTNFSGNSVTAVDSADIFIASYNANGNLRWVMTVGGAVDDPFLVGTEEAGRGICVDVFGDVIITGAFRSNAAFAGTTLTGWMHTDIFIAKIEQPEPPFIAMVIANGSTNFCQGQSVELKANIGTGFSYEWLKDGSPISNAHANNYFVTETGSYRVKITNNGNSVISEPLPVNVKPNPTASFSHTDNLLLVTFSNASLNSLTYMWDFGDGDTSSIKNPSHDYAFEGTYEVCLIAINSCSVDTFCKSFTIDDGLVSLEKHNIDFDYSISPNPVVDILTINYNGISQKEAMLRLISVEGKIILTEKMSLQSNSQKKIEVLSYKSGMYFLELDIAGEKIVKKIVIN